MLCEEKLLSMFMQSSRMILQLTYIGIQDVTDVNVETAVPRYHEHVSCFSRFLQLVVQDCVIASGQTFLASCSKISKHY